MLLLNTTFTKLPVAAILLILFAIILVIWAVISMTKSRLKILPEPAKNATLITDGPYKYIRHPMYTALIMGSIGLVIAHFTWLRLFLLAGLFLVLVYKLLYEEALLSEKFDDYAEYKRNTYRLFPFVF